MKSKEIRKAMMKSVLALTVSGVIAGCTAESENPENQTPAEPVKKESAQETNMELTGRQLIFEPDMEEMAEKVIPDYILKKNVKRYTGNKDAGKNIHTEDGGQTSIINGEIRDQAVSMDEEEAVVKAKEWIDTAFVEFDVSLIEDNKPLIMSMRKTELSDEPKEVITGYRIEYENRYDNYKVQGEGIIVLLDDIGVTYGTITWNEYEKIDSPENDKTVQTVDFERSKILLENAITKENEEFGLDENNPDARTVEKVELLFYENAEEEYIPAWYYEMMDGRAYYVDCRGGQVSHP